MKKLLLLEVNSNAGGDLLGAAKRLGVETHVATHADHWDDYPAETKELTDATVFTDFGDLARARKELVAYALEHHIDGVVTGWEFFSGLTIQIAADLGLPGHDPEFATAVRNKREMAAAFVRASAPAPRTLSAESSRELRARISGAGLRYPIVIKPADNAGSIGVSVVRDEEEIDAAVRLAQGWPVEFPHGTPLDTAVLAQEYVDGREFSVESAIIDGRIRHLAITQKITTQGLSRAETGHTVPAQLEQAETAELLRAVEAGTTALGLRCGISHTEVKLSSAGTAKLIEIGVRPPGDNIVKLVELATGVSEAAVYIQLALGLEPDLKPTRHQAAAIRFLTPPGAGVFRGVEGLPEDDNVVDIVVTAEPGQRVDGPTDNTARVGSFTVTAPAAADANALADEIVRGLTVVVGA